MDIDNKLTGFVAARLNQLLDFDKRYGAQCYDLIQYWSQFIGGPFISGAVALDIANFQSPFYTWVENTPTNVPANGDIMVLKEPYGKYIDSEGIVRYAGHTGVVVKADVNKFTLFEQNDPTGSAAHLQEYTYEFAKGWLHPNIAPATTTQVVADTTMQDAVTACQTQLKAESETNATLRGQISSDEDLISTLRTEKENIQKELDQLKLDKNESDGTIVALKGEISQIHTEDADYLQKSIDSTHLADLRLGYLKKIMDAAGTTYDPTKEEEIMHEIAKSVVANRDNQTVDNFGQAIAKVLKSYNADEALKTLGLSPLDPTNLQDPQEIAKGEQLVEEFCKALIDYEKSIQQNKELLSNPLAQRIIEEVKKPSFLSSLGGLFHIIFRKPSTSI